MESNPSLKTPLYHHLTPQDLENLYPPSEDTFLLIDSLEKDFVNINDINPSICVELGLGPGLVITALGQCLGPSCSYYGTDINPLACEKAAQTGHINGVLIKTFKGDLASGLPEDVKGKIDVLMFNPPYVVTDSDEVASGNLESTWAGGVNGREVIDRLLPQIDSLLSSKGLFYLLLERSNKPLEVVDCMKEMGFQHELILERRAANERLSVHKFKKQA